MPAPLYCALLLHPDLGPKVVQSLPLEEVLKTLRRVSVKVQDIAEDTIVEAYIQETIRPCGQLHRLDPMLPHYWTYANVPRGKWILDRQIPKLLDWDPCETNCEAAGESRGRGGSVGLGGGRGGGGPAFRDASEQIPSSHTLFHRVQCYLLENVFTSELREIGSFKSRFDFESNSGWWQVAVGGESYSLPESIAQLPATGNESLCLAHQRGLLGPIEKWAMIGVSDPMTGKPCEGYSAGLFKVLRDPAIHCRLSVLTLDTFTTGEVLTILASCGTTLEKLALQDLYFMGGGKDTTSETAVFDFWIKLMQLIGRQAHLQTLVVQGLTDENGGDLLERSTKDQLTAMFSPLSALKALTSLSFCPERYGDSDNPPISCVDLAMQIKRHLPQLRRIQNFAFRTYDGLRQALDIVGPQLDFIRPSEQDHYLSMDPDYDDWQGRAAESIAAKFPKLTVHWNRPNQRTIAALAKSPSAMISELHLQVGTDAELSKVLSDFPDLLSLRLTFISPEEDGGLEEDSEREGQDPWSIRGEPKVTDRTGIIIGSKCPKLLSLGLNGGGTDAPTITDKFLLHVASRCPDLHCFDLAALSGLSVQNILWCCRRYWPSISYVDASALNYFAGKQKAMSYRFLETLAEDEDVDLCYPPADMKDCLPTRETCPKLTKFSMHPAPVTLIPWLQEYVALLKLHGRNFLENAQVLYPELSSNETFSHSLTIKQIVLESEE